ncbi:CREB/ATF bZIP transcription factor [Empidonax traillii]|uniref:CREB/ATF bZIP transcription factor n=1 Tax=Empidonax traillii TaxID=164674 RepID=UPI000FFD05A5|nr:CREB/ATF bZIP transcription factor [Empidonax traillii]
MRHSLTQLLAASAGGTGPSGAAWPLSGAGQAPRGRDVGGEGDPGPARPKPPGASEPRRQEKEAEAPSSPVEVWEQEDWFPGLELGDLLEAARPDWDLEAELSGCFCEEPEPLPPPGQGPRPAVSGRRSGGAGSRLKAAAAARLNRLKKKQYVLGLESRLQGLAAENRQLRDRNRGLSRRLRELERESSYLRAVLANQSALGQLLSRLAGTRAGGLQLSTSLFRDTGSPRRQHQHLQPAGESSDHDYALPSSRPRGLEEAAVGTEAEEEWAAPGGICLHVDRDQVSVEFCSICARRAAASFKIFSFRCLPCQAPLCRG